MIEEGDSLALAQHARIKEAEAVVRRVCSTLPEGRIVKGTPDEPDVCDSVADDGSLPAFAAISIIESFCRSLPADEFVSARPVYTLTEKGSGFMATCCLPPVSEVPLICGGLRGSKRDAKAEAALCAVNELFDRKLLDANYNPLNHAQSGDIMEDYDLCWNHKLRQDWIYRGPNFWKQESCAQYHFTRIRTNKQGPREYADLLLVTKSRPLLELPQMVFYNLAEEFVMTCKNFSGSAELSTQQETILLNFTDRLLKVMVNKKFAGTMADHVSQLAPRVCLS